MEEILGIIRQYLTAINQRRSIKRGREYNIIRTRHSEWSFLVLLIEKSNWLNQEDFVLIFEIK